MNCLLLFSDCAGLGTKNLFSWRFLCFEISSAKAFPNHSACLSCSAPCWDILTCTYLSVLSKLPIQNGQTPAPLRKKIAAHMLADLIHPPVRRIRLGKRSAPVSSGSKGPTAGNDLWSWQKRIIKYWGTINPLLQSNCLAVNCRSHTNIIGLYSWMWI